MKGYKEPSFQDRVALAKNAKEKALAQLRDKPVMDAEEKARRLAIQAARDEAQRVKHALMREAKEAAIAAKKAADIAQGEQERLSAETALAMEPTILTDADLKSARDLKYAARKARKGRKS